jgi:phage terminase large subunit
MVKLRQPTKEDIKIFQTFQKSPLPFIKIMWHLSPQPVKPECVEEVKQLIKEKRFNEIKVHHFGPFIRGKHLTWQQWLICLAVRDALTATGKKRISVASGHGIGKSSLNAMLIIWFLYTFPCSNVPCTAPTGDQLQGALWKELAVWLSRMPEQEANRFEMQNDHLRVNDPAIKDSGRIWWARARTGKKENPEALAGIHSKNVMVIVDEASGVHDKVYEVMEGALTEENVIVLMISNYTRNVGYFHASQTRLAHLHSTFSFSSIESPIPSDGYAEQIIALYGKDSDQYRVRVLGLSPREEAVDDKGYVSLFRAQDVIQIPPTYPEDFQEPAIMGVDPAGEGVDKSTIVIRDNSRAQVVLEEKISNPKQLARRTIGLMLHYKVKPEHVFVDMFGTGAEFVKEMALAGYNLTSITVGERPTSEEDKELYLNKRAAGYFKIKRWLRQGGELVQHNTWEQELTSIRYRRGLSGKIQIMSKKDMKAAGFHSPNSADALMLTFIDDEQTTIIRTITQSQMAALHRQHQNKTSSSDEEYTPSNTQTVRDPFSAV